jgi:molecular chaperone HtpG
LDHHFQVHLRGIIELLSNHLYSGPEVFVRELLQNATDAIRAREAIEPGFAGEIELELTRPRDGGHATLTISENGIGLTEAEIHRFLATIGESSKRNIATGKAVDFVGQFGIGLLSCFMVSDEIVAVTRSALPGNPAIEWRGRSDGTYTVRELEADIAAGTSVYLTCKPGSEEFFESDRLAELARHFGGLLPFPIRLKSGRKTSTINDEKPPWRRKFASAKKRTEALLEYGSTMFEQQFFDAIALDLSAEGADGVALVLDSSPGPTQKSDHRLYLKNMFLTDQAGDIVPPWAFFVRVVLNSDKLRPNAAREGVQEDAAFRRTRDAIGRKLRGYLIELSEHDPEKLARLIALHDLSIRALAVDDDEFCRIVFDWLPVETSQGDMTLGQYRARHDVIRYATSLDQFRQIAQVAAAQGLCVINAAYVHMSDLMEKYAEVFEDGRVQKIDAEDMVDTLADLNEAEDRSAAAFLELAETALSPLRCRAELKRFDPAELPCLYTSSAEGQFLRTLERSKDVAAPAWSGILGALSPANANLPTGQLCFNFSNPLVQGLLTVTDGPVLRRAIEMLYVQALLMGHHPLSEAEMKLLSGGLLALIEMAVDKANPGGGNHE